MRVMFDLNILVDIAEAREGFYEASRQAFELALSEGHEAFFPVHAFTTLHYLLARQGNAADSRQYVSWLCEHVQCVPADIAIIRAACASAVSDFEDAVVDESAFAGECDYIVTRNTRHFARSRVQAITPLGFVHLLKR